MARVSSETVKSLVVAKVPVLVDISRVKIRYPRRETHVTATRNSNTSNREQIQASLLRCDAFDEVRKDELSRTAVVNIHYDLLILVNTSESVYSILRICAFPPRVGDYKFLKVGR